MVNSQSIKLRLIKLHHIEFGVQADLGVQAGENILGLLQVSRFLLYRGVLEHHRHCNVMVPGGCDQPGNLKALRECWARTPGSSGKLNWHSIGMPSRADQSVMPSAS